MLEDTRERALPVHAQQTPADYLVYLKHLALYEFAKNYCPGRFVLDLGCGEGYGSDVLATVARLIVAADYSPGTVAHARAKYAHANVAFVVCDAQHLPFQNAVFDTVVTFEVIEHIPDVRRYLEEIKRVGTLASVSIISTPNRLLRLLPFQRPWNRFHLREYDDRGLARVVSTVFSRVQMRGISAIPAILEIEKRRVKQNPIIAYSRMMAQLLLPHFIYDGLKRLRRKPIEFPVNPTNASMVNFSVDDFTISNAGLRTCINLIAIGETGC